MNAGDHYGFSFLAPLFQMNLFGDDFFGYTPITSFIDDGYVMNDFIQDRRMYDFRLIYLPCA